MFVCVNGIVLVNAVLHDPRIQYDTRDHLAYIETLARGNLVSPQESREFFCPPLPYLIPAALVRAGAPLLWAAKGAQLINVALSLLLTLYLLKTCDLVRPENPYVKIGTLGFLALLPVYYRTFAFLRGEPWVALFTVLIVYYALRVVLFNDRGAIVPLGLSMGGIALSRQWGVLLFPGLAAFVFLWMIRTGKYKAVFLPMFSAALIALIISGWFYIHLRLEYGTITAFNKKRISDVRLANQDQRFYFGTGDGMLFEDPVRPRFRNQFIPLFYSDTWGDYWMFFVFYGRNGHNCKYFYGPGLQDRLERETLPSWFQTNRFSMAAYLARGNVIALAPTAVAFAALIFAVMRGARGLIRGNEADALSCLCVLLLLSSAIGYFWFLVSYPSPGKGATIKATYMIQLFPMVGLLVGQLAGAVRGVSAGTARAVLFAMVGVFMYFLPVYFTRYFLLMGQCGK